jgi:hypothetical protein
VYFQRNNGKKSWVPQKDPLHTNPFLVIVLNSKYVA